MLQYGEREDSQVPLSRRHGCKDKENETLTVCQYGSTIYLYTYLARRIHPSLSINKNRVCTREGTAAIVPVARNKPKKGQLQCHLAAIM